MTKSKWIAGFLAGAALLGSPFTLAAQEWVVEEKSLSIATGLSNETRAFLTAIGPPDVAERRNTKPGSIDEWRAFIKTVEEENPLTMKKVEQMFGVRIETGQLAGVTVHTVHPATTDPAHKQHIFIHLHGGAYVLGSGARATLEASAIASTGGIKVVSVDYTLSVDEPFPASLNDVIAVYEELLKTVPATAIGVGGTSAGGGLTLATVLRLKELELPVPGALFAGTPWADLAATGDTIITNEGIDNVLATNDGFLDSAARLYAGEHDLNNPLISPYYGDFSGFPPTYLVSGTRDMLLSDTVRVHRKLREAGATADLNVFEGLPHGGYIASLGSREFNGTYGGLGDFLLRHLSSGP